MVRARDKSALQQRLDRFSPAQLARLILAQKRIQSILARHGIANHRTLEQKISDAGPFNQRINPHVLATAFEVLRRDGELLDHQRANGSWLYLPTTPSAVVEARLAEQTPIWAAIQKQALTMRIGQALEIAVYRSLLTQSALGYIGGYADLDDHDDATLYSKEDPSLINGRSFPQKKRVDFVVAYDAARWAVLEVKNTREWLYPSHSDVRELLAKALAVDAVPVLIGRRIPFVTFRVLSPCGLVIHQTYNQRYPNADANIAAQARDKNLLGYHDIRLGNDPDDRLIKFIHVNLPKVLSDARLKFESFRDLLEKYTSSEYSYAEFAARVRRRERGINEDSDGPYPEDVDIEEDF